MAMQLTLHFDLEDEFQRTSTGLANVMPQRLLGNAMLTCCMLEEIRAVLGRPVFLSRGYSSAAVNAKVGGQPGSRHLEALAADVLTEDAMADAEKLKAAADRLPLLGKLIVERRDGCLGGHLHVEPRLAEGPIKWLVKTGAGYPPLWP